MKRDFNPVDVKLNIENPFIERDAFYRLCFITESNIAPRTLKVTRLQDLLESGYSRLDLVYNFCVGVFSQQGIDTVYIRAKRNSESYIEAYNSDDNSAYYFVVLQTKDLTEVEKFNSHLVSSDEMKLQFFSQNVGSKTLQSPKLVNYYQDYTLSGGVPVESKDYYLNKAYDGVTVVNKIPLPDYLLAGYGDTAVDYGVRIMVGKDYIWEIDKPNRQIRYAPASTPSPVENWKYLPIYDVAVQVKRNSISGHAESIEAVNNSLPFVIPNYESSVTITGIAKVGEVLTATVTDKNGVPSNINYQWYADGEVISGATSDTYVIKEAEAGKGITVKAQFTDNDGYVESVTSPESELVVPDKPPIDLTINNIGIQGTANFGVGITDNLPDGMSEMEGTRVLGHENYGNYQYSDGSIMCWIPKFYYRWAGADSPYATKYGLNSCDVKSKYDFVDEVEANAAGYALHRAFYDGGQIKDGFFVDKYQASNNGGIASSIRDSNPVTTNATYSPFSMLNGSPTNTFAGAINAVKTRGTDFFPTTLFVQRALSLLSMAHAQAAISSDSCAWYDSTGVANHPKGCNNNTSGDVNDVTVTYPENGDLARRTGSGTPIAKTTHNGQSNGVVDLNGNIWEVCLGLTQLSGKFYALKTSTKVSALTSDSTASGAWSTLGIAENYVSLGSRIGALSGTVRTVKVGKGAEQVFSSAATGTGWQASCAGIPLTTGVSSLGTDLFGHDVIYDDRVDNLCPTVGGYYGNGELAGVWSMEFTNYTGMSNNRTGVRAALYNV